jgi:hypothetical protein
MTKFECVNEYINVNVNVNEYMNVNVNEYMNVNVNEKWIKMYPREYVIAVFGAS